MKIGMLQVKLSNSRYKSNTMVQLQHSKAVCYFFALLRGSYMLVVFYLYIYGNRGLGLVVFVPS